MEKEKSDMEIRDRGMRSGMVLVLSLLLLLAAQGYAGAEAPSGGGIQTSNSWVGSSAIPENYLLTGAATYGIPIAVPPGRKNMAPSVAINYNSYSGNGLAGVGFDVPYAAITRSTKFGLNYSANDYVVSGTGSAELVRRDDWGSNYYGVKIESGFSKYYYNSSTGGWIVFPKDGSKVYYGTTSASRQDNSYGVFKWCIDRIEDTNGNYVTFTYTKDQGQIYLSRIDYTGHTSGLNPTNYVKFNLESRQDVMTSYRTKSKVVTDKRLKNIEVYGKDNLLARKYALTYETEAATKRSRLDKVEFYGSDATTTVPPIDFTWREGASGSFLSSYSSNSGQGGLGEGYVRLADVNGDGYTDLIRNDSSGNVYTHLAKEDGTFDTTYSTTSGPGGAGDGLVAAADVNGDGKADLIKFDNSGNVYTFLSKGDGTFESNYKSVGGPGGQGKGFFNVADVNGDGRADLVKWDSNGSVYVFLAYSDGSFSSSYQTTGGPGGDGANKVIVCDVNGDGRADLLKLAIDGMTVTVHTALSNGDGTFGSFSATNGPGTYIQLADFNADGLTDLIRYGDDGTVYFFYSKGDGTFDTNYLSHSGQGGAGPGLISFSDVNGDGIVDLLKFTTDGTVYTYLSHGDGTFESVRTHTGPGGGTGLIQFADVNGDGVSDLVKHNTSGQVYTYLTSGSGPTGMLASMRNTPGASITLEYKSSSKYQNTLLPFIVNTVSSIRVDDGFGNIMTTNYTYFGGLYDFAKREFRGFQHAKLTNPDNTTVEKWFHQDEFFQGLEDKVEFRSSSGDLFSKTVPTYEKTYIPSTNAAFVKAVKKRVDSYDSETVTLQDTMTHDDVGNLLTVSSSGPNAETLTRTNTYQNLGTWMWRLVSEKLEGSTSGKVRESTYSYDTTTGNLQSKTAWLEGGTNPTVQMTYDTYGNIRTATDPRGKVISTDYDAETNTFPIKITHPPTGPVTHVKELAYDYRFGKPNWAKDENGNITTTEYDPFGRLANAFLPDGGEATAVYYDYTLPRQKMTSVKENDLGTTINKREFSDGLGRPVQAVTFGEDGKIIVSQVYYDSMGRKYLTRGPFFSNSLYYPQSPSSDHPWQKVYYDERGRPVKIETPNTEHGVVESTISYVGLASTATDPDGSKKTVHKDYLGKLIKVTEYDDYDNPQFTTYQYNAAGDLRFVTNHFNKITEIQYDSLGRKIWMNDPDMGQWQYAYDAGGNLVSQINAKSQTVTFAYDDLNRVLTKSYSTSDPQVTYSYDNLSIPNGRGRPSSVSNGNVVTTYNAYDKMGRPLSASKRIDGDSNQYTTQYEYDLAGKLTRIFYPDGFDVSYGYYPGTGLLRSVQGSDLIQYTTYTDYEATGRAGQVYYGNQTASRYTFDPLSGRLHGIVTADPTDDPLKDIIRKEFSYSPAGDIQKVIDGIRNTTYEYSYDKLHRLIGETNTSEGAAASSADVISLNYDEQGKPHHGVCELILNGTSHTYTYDANGNMTSGPGFPNSTIETPTARTLTFNADNMPLTVALEGGTQVQFVYDGHGKRAKKIQGGIATYYYGSHFEIRSGEITKHVFAGSERIATLKGGYVYFYHKDHLGSSNVATDRTAEKIEKTEYMPFGGTREHSGTKVSDYKFTDQELDAEIGLYNYNARLYDPVIGRFLSADTVIPDFSDPQDLDRYAYCGNNPLKSVDPSGHFSFGRFFKIFAVAVVAAVVTVVTYGAAAAAGWSAVAAVAAAGAAGGAVAGGLTAAVNGGGPADIFKGLVMGGIIGGVAGAVVGAWAPAAYGMLAAGAGYSAYKGGLEGLAYFGAGVAGALVGGAIGAEINAALYMPELMSSAPVEGDPLRFDGRELTATDQDGNFVDSFRAGSGREGSTSADQWEIDFGPIPERQYMVDPSKIQKWSDVPFWKKPFAILGRTSTWKGGPARWGYYRVPITTPDGAFTVSNGSVVRGEFFIHGSTDFYSAGCIDLGPDSSRFFNYLSGQKDPIPLEVKY